MAGAVVLTGKEYIEFVIPIQSNGSPCSVPIVTGEGGLSIAKLVGVLTPVVAVEADFVSTVTLANVTGMTVQLNAGITYAFRATLPISSGSGGGVKFAFNTTDTLSFTSINLTGKFYTAAGVAVSNTTSTTLGVAVGSTATVILAELAGSLVVNTAGTLVLQAAQNASSATTTGILVGGFLRVLKTN